MKKFYLLWLAALMIGSSIAGATAEARDLDGRWEGERYSIELDDTWDEIDGRWGDKTYDLEVDETWNEIEGRINGIKVDIEIDETWDEITGDLPCGKVDLEWDTSWNEIEGEICGNEIDIDLDDSPESVVPTVQWIFMSYLLEEFPVPTRRAIRHFILARLKFVEEN